MRPRISQMLVLPPFQRQGLGAKLLDTVSKYYWNNPKVVDITGKIRLKMNEAEMTNVPISVLFYTILN